MKPIFPTLVICGLMTSQSAFGQQTFSQRVQSQIQANQSAPEANFTAFNLDFPGGTPAELVAAIEKATSKPLNAIIPTEHADVQLPPLKMRNVTAPRLFESLQHSSLRQVRYETGSIYPGLPGNRTPNYSTSNVAHGFRAVNNLFDGDDTIWTFFVEGAPLPMPDPIACRYYQLEPFLESYSIDDITTAIQTGWRMLGEKEVPELSFHQETKLLIAVGDPSELALIDDVLKQLQPQSPKAIALPPPPANPKESQ